MEQRGVAHGDGDGNNYRITPTRYEIMNETIKELAVKAYEAYTAAVGGVNFKGEPLPSGEEFFSDPSKEKQAAGWIAAVDATKRDVFDLANTLPQKEHGRLIGALAAYHAATWGKEYLPVKVKNWLDKHGGVWTAIVVVLGLLAAGWLMTGCTTAVKQSQTATDGSVTTTERYFSLSAAEARDFVKLYGIPMVPVVNSGK